uniref:Uncharacterized protein n=1 Tax=Leersia perrieri TaxID=77586 RepID=A0A0D9WBB8_9ORYZ
MSLWAWSVDLIWSRFPNSSANQLQVLRIQQSSADLSSYLSDQITKNFIYLHNIPYISCISLFNTTQVLLLTDCTTQHSQVFMYTLGVQINESWHCLPSLAGFTVQRCQRINIHVCLVVTVSYFLLNS